MTIPIFGLNSIKDKATRDAIQTLAMKAGIGGGDASIEVMGNDPDSNTPGNEGDVIYSTSSDSIWVFTGTEWERAIGGNGIYVQVRCATPQSDDDYEDWLEASTVIRNDSATETRALVATLIENGVAHTNEEHDTYTYQWYKNGAAVTEEAGEGDQNNFTGATERAFIIKADDVANRGSEAFSCSITY